MKKHLCIVMIIVIILNCLTINVFADSGSDIYKGVLERDPSLGDRYDELSDAQKEKYNEKKAILEAIRSQPVTYSNTWESLDTFTIYTQLFNYYCGPACVKSTLNYINGSAPSQITIAIGCNTTTSGTYMSDMVEYMNSKQDAVYYIDEYGAAKVDFGNCLYADIAYYGVPSIVGFACRMEDGWQYNSNGHVCCVVAVRSDRGEVILADPFIGYIGGSEVAYYRTLDKLYAAYSSANCGYCW